MFTGKFAAGVVPLLFDAPGQAGLAVGVSVVFGADVGADDGGDVDGGVVNGEAEALEVVGGVTTAVGNGDADSEGGDSMFVAGIAGGRPDVEAQTFRQLWGSPSHISEIARWAASRRRR